MIVFRLDVLLSNDTFNPSEQLQVMVLKWQPLGIAVVDFFAREMSFVLSTMTLSEKVNTE